MASTFTLSTAKYQGRYLKLTCKQTKNVSSNNSTISWELESIGGSSSYYSTGPTTVKINGVTVYYSDRKSWTTESFPAAKGEKTGTLQGKYVPHGNDGKKSIEVSITTAIYVGNTTTVKETWILDNIPRFSTPSNPKSFTDLSKPTVDYTNNAGAETYIGVFFSKDTSNCLIGWTKVTGKSGTKQFTLTDANKKTLYNKFYKSYNTTIYYGVKSTIGKTTEVKWSTAVKASIDKDYKPTIDNISMNDLGDAYPIKGETKITLKIPVTTKKGAGRQKCSIEGTNLNYNDNDKCYKISNFTPTKKTYTIDFVDTRGDKISKNYTIPNFVEYFNPSITYKITTSLEKVNNTTKTVGSDNILTIDDDNDSGDGLNSVIGADQITGTIKIEYTGLFYSGNIAKNTSNYLKGDITIKDSLTVIQSKEIDFEESFMEFNKDLKQGKIYNVEIKYYDRRTQSDPTIITTQVLIGPVFDWNNNNFSFYVPVKYPAATWTDLKMWFDYDDSDPIDLNLRPEKKNPKEAPHHFCAYCGGNKVEILSLNDYRNASSTYPANHPKFIQQGDLVTVRGRITVGSEHKAELTKNQSASASLNSLQPGYNNMWFAKGAPGPATAAYCLCQGSKGSIWLLTISTSGYLGISRFREAGSTTFGTLQPVCSSNAGEWLIFDYTYSVAK